MKRVAIVGMPATGHVNPSLPLVRELVHRNIEVTYYISSEFDESVQRAGAQFRPYPERSISARDIAEATQSGSSVQVVARVLNATEVLLPFLRDEFNAERPDAVVYDSDALWGRMAAASLGLPTISLMTTMLLGLADFKALIAREWIYALRDMAPGLPQVIAARRRVLRRFGKRLLPPSPMLPMFGDVTLFPIPRQIQLPKQQLNSSCHFIGPTIDREVRDTELDPELAAHLNDSDSKVLISLGTLHTGSNDFFRTCFAALADLPMRAVISIGHHVDPAGLGSPPANILVRATVPQLEILRTASVFVTHGGMNSVLEAINYGVPLVVIPQQIEQLIIGLIIADHGAAVVLRQHLSHRPIAVNELRTAVQRALTEPSLRTQAETLGATFSQGGGAAAGAEIIQSLL